MSYTYEDFLKAANNEGMMSLFSEDDLKIAQTHPEYGISLLSLHKDAANATTDDAKLLATEAMKQLRSNYAPADTTTAQPAGSFVYDNEAAYKEALNAVVNGKPFEYNHETDPLYSSFAKTYRREGQRATEDTLARVAAASGGSVPTSAVTAATQAGDYYAAQLADSIPQLQQQAYTNYLNEESLKQARLNVLAADRQQKQNDWLQNYNLQQAERERLTQLMSTLGYEPTAEQLAAAGISADEAKIYMDYYKKATSGGGGGSKRVNLDEVPSWIASTVEGVYNQNGYDSAISFIETLQAGGYINDVQALSLAIPFEKTKPGIVDRVAAAAKPGSNILDKVISNINILDNGFER